MSKKKGKRERGWWVKGRGRKSEGKIGQEELEGE
jgi:hypothetical protein